MINRIEKFITAIGCRFLLQDKKYSVKNTPFANYEKPIEREMQRDIAFLYPKVFLRWLVVIAAPVLLSILSVAI